MTIRTFAEMTNTSATIARAMSYDTKLALLFDMPCGYSDRLKKSTGRGGHAGINLHPALRNNPRQLRATFLHEVAHVMEWVCYKKCGHSYNWQEAMIRLGQNPHENRYHSIGIELRQYHENEQTEARALIAELF